MRPNEVDTPESSTGRTAYGTNGAGHGGGPAQVWKPSGITIWSIVLASTALVVVAFLAGYVPLKRRTAVLADEAKAQEQALPRVEVLTVGRADSDSELELPGNIQPITEAPILARADGYIRKRYADIGDRVQAGQVLAEIEAPEMDEQGRQAAAALLQAQAAVDQALASYEQGKSDAELARITAERWSRLAQEGVVSKQDNDQYQAQYQSKAAALRAYEKAIAVQRANVSAAEANLARLGVLKSYRTVRAPFTGVITLRNLDVGALVSAGTTLIYRIAQTELLRTYVNVPQSFARSIKTGQPARLTVSNLPGREFSGVVARTANALDPGSRTLLVEIHVPNSDGTLLPGLYAMVNLMSPRAHAPLVVPSDALIVRSEGTNVAAVRSDNTVHLQKVGVGRDYGDKLEIVSGLAEGDRVIQNPGDVQEGLRVDPVPAPDKARGGRTHTGSAK